MCNIILRQKDIKNDFSFILFNIAFSEKGGKFNENLLLKRLEEKNININKAEVHKIIIDWLEDGLIFEDIDGYLISNCLKT